MLSNPEGITSSADINLEAIVTCIDWLSEAIPSHHITHHWCCSRLANTHLSQGPPSNYNITHYTWHCFNRIVNAFLCSHVVFHSCELYRATRVSSAISLFEQLFKIMLEQIVTHISINISNCQLKYHSKCFGDQHIWNVAWTAGW
jgi:hypothetical protein